MELESGKAMKLPTPVIWVLTAVFPNALEFNHTREASASRNRETGAEGSVTPVRTHESTTATWYRKFEASVAADDVSELTAGHACRERDGTLQIVEYRLGANRDR